MTKNYFLSKLQLLFLGIFVVFVQFVFAQNYTISFQEQVVNIPENIDTFRFEQLPEYAEFNGGYYGWVQFYQTPTQAVQDNFKAQGLKLIEYIPHYAYLFHFPKNISVNFLKNNGVRGIIPVSPELKISKELNYPPFEDWAMDGENILITLILYDGTDSRYAISELEKMKIRVVEEFKGTTYLHLSIPDNCLTELASMPFVKWVELITAPSIPDDFRGRSIHRSNGLDTMQGLGTDYTGAGVGVMVRDDGIVGPHIDFQGRLDNSRASGTGQTHGDGVAGIMAGAGNRFPHMRGMAAGADVYVVNYQSHFLDSHTLYYINNGITQITNSSYSNGCNTGYTSTTVTVDTQTNNIPNLLHVFSAGNSNNSNCGYGAGNQWGNITGGHKQGKNVITTANVYYNGTIVGSSSRGPAHDGRIKPDITAHGQDQNSTSENNNYQVFGGTSGAAPGIAGVAAQLYELYASLNGGNHPNSALIKAAILNTANEAGNVGPDFKFGWGIINGKRAGKLLEDGRFLTTSVTQGVTNTHTINIPANTSQVRFMIYWHDPTATEGANPALVNDLDLVVKNPSNTSFLPWVLDHTPNPVNLDLPATTGVDRLDNVEQVLINDPQAGNYTVEVSGFNVPVGPQTYYLVYEIISNDESLVITYPNGGENFVHGQQEVIHWDAINAGTSFTLEYTTNNGGSWTHIANVNNTTNYTITIPNVTSGQVKFRVTAGSLQSESAGVLSIAPPVSGIQITQVCPYGATFTWNTATGADSYDFYLLGEKYMEIVGTTNTNSITIPISNPNTPMWFTVRAKNVSSGWTGRRSSAIYYGGGLLNCSMANDIGVAAINNLPSDFNTLCSGNVTVSAKVINNGSNAQTDFTVNYQLNSEPVVTENFTGTLSAGQNVDYEFATPLTIYSNGENVLKVWVELTGDQNSSNDEMDTSFYTFALATFIPFAEDFESNGFPPDSWIIHNPDGLETWIEQSGITGSTGSNTKAAFLDNYNYNATGQLDSFTTEIFRLVNAESAELHFDLAKAQYSTSYSDGLRVEASIDCGETFTEIYFKNGMDLSTLPGYETTPSWTPSSADHWRTETVDLTPFLGKNVMFRFVNICSYGNSTFLDNINITGVVSTPEYNMSEFTMYPNPAGDAVHILFEYITEDTGINIYNLLGQPVYTLENISTNNNLVTINTTGLSSGVYFVSVKEGTNFTTKKLVIK